jgi:hypothetical protein
MAVPVRSLVTGGLLGGATVAIVLAGRVLPGAGDLLGLAAPVPVALLTARHGLRSGVLATLASACVLLAPLGPLAAVQAAAAYGGVGVACGWALPRLGMAATAAVTAGGALVAPALELAAARLVLGPHAFTALAAALAKALLAGTQVLAHVLPLLGVRGPSAARLIARLAAVRPLLATLAPYLLLALLAARRLVAALACFALTRLLLPRLGLPVAPPPPALRRIRDLAAAVGRRAGCR